MFGIVTQNPDEGDNSGGPKKISSYFLRYGEIADIHKSFFPEKNIEGVSEDNLAVEIFDKLAQLAATGDGEALNNLGVYYEKWCNFVMAAKMYKKAISAGFEEAVFNMGMCNRKWYCS